MAENCKVAQRADLSYKVNGPIGSKSNVFLPSHYVEKIQVSLALFAEFRTKWIFANSEVNRPQMRPVICKSSILGQTFEHCANITSYLLYKLYTLNWIYFFKCTPKTRQKVFLGTHVQNKQPRHG